MKYFILMSCLVISSTTFAASKTISQCAVNNVVPSGARVNLLEEEDGSLKANLIFGSTVSGQSYQVKQVSPGVFVGSIRNKPQFPIKLVISSVGKTNAHVNGYASSLEAVYPDVTSSSGVSSVKTSGEDAFVCGKIIARF